MTTEPTVRPVDYDVDGLSATLTLNVPANRNALSATLVEGMHRGLDEAESESGVRVVVLGHTGGTFCAGADLAEAAREGGPKAGTRRLVDLLRRILAYPKPVIAVIDGHVRAGGLGLLGACDLAVAGPASTFALTEARLGLAPAIISLTLADRVDPRAWSRYALSGEIFDAEQAARIGVVTCSVAEPEPAVAELVASFRATSPQGLSATKSLCNAALLERFDACAPAMVERSAELFSSEEAQEGIAAFAQRRPPRWAIG